MQWGDLGPRGRVLMAPGQPPQALPHPSWACVQEGQQAGERGWRGASWHPAKGGKVEKFGCQRLVRRGEGGAGAQGTVNQAHGGERSPGRHTGVSVAQPSQPTHGVPTFGSAGPAQSVALVSAFNWL